MTIIPDRFEQLAGIQFASGGHDPDDGAMCVMEAVAWIAGEECAGAAAAAAWAAARAAAWDAALDAAWAALAPTVAELQASAVELVERMCAVTS